MSSTPTVAPVPTRSAALFPGAGSIPTSVCRAAVHGWAVEIDCQVAALSPELHRLLAPFEVPGWPEGFTPVRGSVLPFSAEAVSRSLSSAAVNISPPDELIELYRDGDRFWVLDDRWGMAELHLVKRQWRSWLLPQPQVDLQRCAEMAILWPLAQLLRLKGLSLIPAVSVVKQGWAALILCPFGIEAELRALLQNGYQLIGQRWTALREEEGRIAMLQLPGRMERLSAPQRRGTGQPPTRVLVDLAAEFPTRTQNHAFCDAVLLVTPGRRTAAASRSIAPAQTAGLLRRGWPIIDLPIGARAAHLPAKLAHACACHEIQLSRNPLDLLQRVEALRSK